MMVADIPAHITRTYYSVISFFWLFPNCILIILSFHKDAIKFTLKSSDYWIKIAYGMLCPIIYTIYEYNAEKRDNNNLQINWLTYVVARGISMPLVMVIWGAFDAIPNFQHKHKSILSVVIAILYAHRAIKFQFLTPSKDDHIFVIQSTGHQISLQSLLASLLGMLSIFLWKQAIDTLRNTDRCVSITYKPYIRWLSSTTGSRTQRSSLGLLSPDYSMDHLDTIMTNECEVNKDKVEEVDFEADTLQRFWSSNCTDAEYLQLQKKYQEETKRRKS